MTGEGGCEQAGKDLFYSFKPFPFNGLHFPAGTDTEVQFYAFDLSPTAVETRPSPKLRAAGNARG